MKGKIIKKYLPNFKTSNGWFLIVSVLMLINFYIEVVTGIDFEILKIKGIADAFKIEIC